MEKTPHARGVLNRHQVRDKKTCEWKPARAWLSATHDAIVDSIKQHADPTSKTRDSTTMRCWTMQQWSGLGQSMVGATANWLVKKMLCYTEAIFGYPTWFGLVKLGTVYLHFCCFKSKSPLFSWWIYWALPIDFGGSSGSWLSVHMRGIVKYPWTYVEISWNYPKLYYVISCYIYQLTGTFYN